MSSPSTSQDPRVPLQVGGERVLVPAEYPKITSFLSWAQSVSSIALVIAAAIAVIALAGFDYGLYRTYPSGVVSSAILAEAEIWIAAAATVGLWTTAQHVSNLSGAIRMLAYGRNLPTSNEGNAPPSLPPVPPSAKAAEGVRPKAKDP